MNLFVHANSILRLVDDTAGLLLSVLLAARLVGELLACGLLAVWNGITANEVSMY